MQYAYLMMYLKIDIFFQFCSKFQIQILKKAQPGFLGSFDMLFLVLQANHFEKISLILIFSLVDPNMT